MKNFKTKDITTIAISIALLFVLSYILYLMSNFIPIPSSRFFMMSPAFSFFMTGAVLKTRKIGTISMISLIFGLLIARFSIFGALALVLSGILSDILTFIIIRKYDTYKSIYLTVPFMMSISSIVSYFVVNIFVPDSRFIQKAFIPTLIISLLIYILGYFISKYTIDLLDKRRILK